MQSSAAFYRTMIHAYCDAAVVDNLPEVQQSGFRRHHSVASVTSLLPVPVTTSSSVSVVRYPSSAMPIEGIPEPGSDSGAQVAAESL